MKELKLKLRLLVLVCFLMGLQASFAQETDIEKEIKGLSKAKWEWMAEKNVDKLATLFHDKSKFVHMSGSWKKERELEIIESGSIWYKQADVHDVVVEIFDNTAVLWNRITLVAHVRGNDVSNEFTVTEIYKKGADGWKLLDLTFSKVRDTHKIAPNVNLEKEIIQLSKEKWQWMADKKVDKLATLFHDKAKFVHMSGTWNKDRELEIIETGSIWYKQADVHDVTVELFDDTAVLWNRITLVAHVRGNDVSNEFTVTEIYKKEATGWKLLDLTFSKVRDTHSIKH